MDSIQQANKTTRKKKKVLFVATVDSHILSFHLPYLKMLQEVGYETHVATNGRAQIPYCDYHHTICMERSPFKTNNLKAISQMRKLLSKEHFDIIHCHTPMGSVVTRLAAKQARKQGTRVIYTAHGFHFYDGAPLVNWLLFYPVEKYLAKYTDTLITINQEDYNRAKQKFAKRCRDIQYIPGVGLDTSKFDFKMTEKEKLQLRESLGLKKDDFVIIYAARIDKNKNHEFIIDVASELISQYPDIHFIFPGRDELHHECQDRVNELGLDSNMHFLGHRSDIPKLLQIANLAVSASKREGLPVNIIEDLYNGLPVVMSECRGSRDIISSGENGYIVEPGDKATFKEYLEKLHNSPELLSRMGSVARALPTDFLLQNTLSAYSKIVTRKKKVLHLLSTNKYSGAENVACQIIKMFKDDDNYEMIYCSPDGEIRRAVSDKGIKFVPIEKLSVGALAKLVKAEHIDIIHAHDIRASVVSASLKMMSLRKNIKIISHIHDNHSGMRRIGSKSVLYNTMRRNFNHIFWVSESCYRDYKFRSNVAARSSILPNVIDEEEILHKATIAKNKEKFDVVFIGRLCEAKNPFRVLNIMKKIIEINGTAKCAIIGDGEFRNGLDAEIKKAGLENNVKLLGFLDNPYGILQNAKVFLMASRHEGLPMVILEAAALGVPIVSTPTDGIAEVIRNKNNGYLSDDDSELVENALIFMEKVKKREKSKARGDKETIQNYRMHLLDAYNAEADK